MLKMKKIMITGMAFLIAMTALAGCGNQRQFRWESDHTG